MQIQIQRGSMAGLSIEEPAEEIQVGKNAPSGMSRKYFWKQQPVAPELTAGTLPQSFMSLNNRMLEQTPISIPANVKDSSVFLNYTILAMSGSKYIASMYTAMKTFPTKHWQNATKEHVNGH